VSGISQMKSGEGLRMYPKIIHEIDHKHLTLKKRAIDNTVSAATRCEVLP